MSESLFSYVDLETRIPAHLPLRKIRQVVMLLWVAWMSHLQRFILILAAPRSRPSG